MVGEGHVQVVDEVDDLDEGRLGPELVGLLLLHLAHHEVEQLSGEDLLVEGGRNRADLLALLALLDDPVHELVDEDRLAVTTPPIMQIERIES